MLGYLYYMRRFYMSSLLTIEEEIQNLPEDDFIVLREWFQDLDSKKWDKQIDADSSNGK